MLQWRLMLATLVAPVDPRGGPIKTELIFGSAATQPVKLHVHRFGLTRHDYVVSDSGGSGVISLKGRRWLCQTNFDECLV